MPVYNPESTIVNIAGVDISGFSDGSFIKVKRNKDVFTQKVGAHGDTVFVKSADRTGIITLNIQSTSSTNDILSALLTADELAPNGIKSVPILINDTHGKTKCTGNGRLSKWPEVERGVDEKGIEWTFLVSNLTIFVGGTD